METNRINNYNNSRKFMLGWEIVMLKFEIIENEMEIINDIKKSVKSDNQAVVNSFDGTDIIQIIVPTLSIVAPLLFQTVQKYFDNDKVSIKLNGIEISAMGYEKAMKLLEKAIELEKLQKISANGE